MQCFSSGRIMIDMFLASSIKHMITSDTHRSNTDGAHFVHKKVLLWVESSDVPYRVFPFVAL
jgi:hypothetical protein